MEESVTILDAATEAAIARTREEVAALHGELVRYGLVVWTGGNVSGRVPGTDLFVSSRPGCRTTTSRPTT
jgi:L-ribulose-5-phosphate 4-epimerase